MNIEQCKADIKRHEGEVLEIYMDSLGYKTLGVGHLCQPNDPEYSWEVGTSVSQEVVDMYYEDDFDKHYKEAIHVFGSQEDFYKLPEKIQHVLVNMCFNLGGSRLSKFRNMLQACREHNWDRMAAEMQNSRWFNQVGRRSIELQQVVLDQ
tara:strand:- start:529 stop:978 length:450 start_codon:yes stop_codon:yes gene_type:complete